MPVDPTDGIAVAHRSWEVDGGGEHVAAELAKAFDAPLYSGQLFDHQPDVDELHELWAGTRYARLFEGGVPLQGLLKMHLWSGADQLADYDTIITSGPEPLWYVPTDGQTMIAYCHSPMRWLFDRYQEHDNRPPGSWFAAVKRLLYESAARRPDVWIANSDIVARRIRQYLNIPERQIRVVYPPVRTADYDPGHRETGDYYVYLGRLSENKQVETIVRAFDGLDRRLVVAGRGPERERLEEIASDSVTFEGYVSEERKADLLAGARAFVFSAVSEDFGMAPVEALASGTPVITVNEGMPPIQIGAHSREGIRGYTYERGETDEETVRNLRGAIRRFESQGVEWSPERIARFAERFDVSEFRRQMHAIVEETREQTEVKPSWNEPTQDEIVTDGPGVEIVPDGGDGS